MKRLALVALLVGCASQAPAGPRAASLPTQPVQSLDGRAAPLRAVVAGSVTVVDLWATWCTACEVEWPKLERLNAAYRERGLRVVGLSVGEAPSVVAAYVAGKPFSYPVYLDPEFRVADALGDKQLPTLLLVDREGRIVHRSASLDQDLLDRIKSLLAAK